MKSIPKKLREDRFWQNKHGEKVVQNVSLFHVAIGATPLNMKVPGSIIHIPKTIEDLEEYKDNVRLFNSKH